MTSFDTNAFLFSVRRSIRYHKRKQRYYEIIDRWCNGVSLVFGSAAFVAIVSGEFRFLSLCAALLVALASVLNLLCASAVNGWLHRSLAERFGDLEILVEKSLGSNPDNGITEKQASELRAERLHIELDEPPTNRLLDLMCHNELIDATYPEAEAARLRYPISVWKERTFLIIPWGVSDIRLPEDEDAVG